MKKYNKTIALALVTAVMILLLPVTSVMAVSGSSGGMVKSADAGLTVAGGLRSNASKDDAAADAAEDPDEAAPEAVANQVVVLYEDGEIPTEAPAKRGQKVPEAASEEALEEAQEKIIDKALDSDFKIDDTIVIETPEETENDIVVGIVTSNEYTSEELADTLGKADGIKYAEPNYRFHTYGIPDWNDTYINDAWQLGEKGVNADKAPAAAESGEPVVLAVMDTGIDYTHPDLRDRMWTAPEGFSLKGEHGVDWVDRDDDPMDENGHGSHCAGIIAAAANNNEGAAGIAGTANVQLMSVRVLDEEGSGYLEDIVRGFKYLIRARNEGVNIKAVNCSFGAATTSDIFDEVIEQAGQTGILTIAAAGNETANNDSVNSTPSNCKSDYVIAVAASDEDGSLASYSNYGQKNVDIAAPGSNILSSVSYYNYAPYLYDNARLQATTQVYGEFGGATIETNEETGEQSVTPVLGTDYNGEAISGVDTFGASRMYSVLTKGSEGHASLEITSPDDGSAFGVGNNQQSLRWKIENAKDGDQYLLYFPYEKLKGEQYLNMVFKPHTDYGYTDGGGNLFIGDVMINDIDPKGNVTYSTSAEYSWYGLYVSPIWNSIWQASGLPYALFDRTVVTGLDKDMYGLGFVYEAWEDGDVYVDISSLGISLADADETEFGAYDVYSGTSMSTPAVTGSVGLIAAADPDIDAETLKATLFGTVSTPEGLAGTCSTGGRVDFGIYSAEPEEAKPSISSVTADFVAGTVTVKGRGFGKTPDIRVFRNAASEDEDAEIAVAADDITADGSKITISKAGYDDYDIIGSDIRFEITNGDRTGEGSFYVVKGLTPYNDEFTTAYEPTDEYEIWTKYKRKTEPKDAEDTDGDGGDEEEEIPEDPQMPSGLSFLAGSNGLYKYDKYGNIYVLEINETNGKYYPWLRGDTVDMDLRAYAEEISQTVEYWKPDTDTDSLVLSYSMMGSPAYMGNVIYELICVDMVDRDAYLLIGMDLSEEWGTWKVYYDSLADYGTKPAELNFREFENTTLAGLGGKLYMFGNSTDTYDEMTDSYTAGISRKFFSCEPDPAGTAWTYEGEMPEARTNGKALVSNGKIFYFFTNDEEGLIDYSMYAYDGTSWEKAGDIPKALFADSVGEYIMFVGDVIIFGYDDRVRIFTAADIDSKGIVFAGKSFDGPGDTFRFNTETYRIEPLEYSLWQAISDRAVDGAAAGDKFFVEYANVVTDEAIGKSFPLETGYVTVEKTVEGEGSGLVTVGGSYSKGDRQTVRIRPDKGSYIYSVSTSGFSPDIEKVYGRKTSESVKELNTTYDAETDASIEVYFGLVSTKVIMPGDTLTMKVGKRTIDAYTDGTISDVKWKSSNTKYAKINDDGTITFKKAGVGKTVTLTATSVEKSDVKASCKVKIVSREKTKFTWNKKKLTSKTKVQIDSPLAKSKTPKSFKVKKKSGKAVLSWKKVSGVSGYIVFRKTGKGRFTQIAKLSASKKTYTDKTIKKGKKYQYTIVSYKKVSGSKAIRISPAAKAKKLK